MQNAWPRVPYRREYLILAGILVIRLLASLWFAVNTPLWEKSDEINHYDYVRFIAVNKRLPTPADYPDWPQELLILSQLNQPPLYYVLLSPVAMLFDSGPPLPVYANPVTVCDAGSPFLQYFIHTTAERFPWHGTVLAVWIGRFLTMLMGLGAVLLVWAAARLLWPADRPLALLAAALFAFMPATVELTSWINNDALLLLTGAGVLYGLAYCRAYPRRRRGWAILGLATILTVLTKLTGLAVVPVVVLFVLYRVVGRSPRRLAIFAVVVLLAVAGFLLASQLQCGHPLCRLHRYSTHFDSFQTLAETLRPDIFLTGIQHFLRTAAAPWLNANYLPPVWMNVIGLGVLFGGLAGAAWRFVTERTERGLLTLLAALVLSAIGLALLRVWWLQIGYMHVRYTAAAMPAMIALLAAGCYALRGLLGRFALVAPVAGLLFLSAVVPPVNYAPLFVMPARYTALPDSAIPLEDMRFASGVQIGGYSLNPAENGLTRLRLYEGTDQPIDQPLFIMVSLLDRSGNTFERCGQTAGSAIWSTLDWQPGEWVAQDFLFGGIAAADRFDIAVYYLQNRYPLVNSYDVDHPDLRTGGGPVRLPPAASP